jgi:hypothetical protein
MQIQSIDEPCYTVVQTWNIHAVIHTFQYRWETQWTGTIWANAL